MDISVERLNNRLALRLPAELPLGLVFVTGTLVAIELDDRARDTAESSRVHVTLEDAGHRLRCVLQDPQRSATELHAGAVVRAGGHLAFDPRRADYVLLARDVDVVGEIDLPVEEGLILELDGLDGATATPILTELNRRAAANGLAPADLPPWVAALAPAAVKAELSTSGNPSIPSAMPAPASAATALDPDLVAAISAALDKGEDVELTQEFLEQYVTAAAPPAVAPSGGTQARPNPTVVQVEAQRSNGWILALLLINLLFLTVVVAAIVYVLFF